MQLIGIKKSVGRLFENKMKLQGLHVEASKVKVFVFHGIMARITSISYTFFTANIETCRLQKGTIFKFAEPKNYYVSSLAIMHANTPRCNP